jgi:hypothetical protein
MGTINQPSDPDTRGGAPTLDASHAHIHEGRSFHADGYEAELDAAASIAFILDGTALQKEVHISFAGEVGADCLGELFEATTHTNGAAVPVFNRNRKLADTANYPNLAANELQIYVSNQDVADGTRLQQEFMPGGSGVNFSPGGGGNSRGEWVLRPGIKYLAKVTNVSAAATALSVSIDWYEVA